MARLRWTVFVKFWGNRDPPELSRLLRGKANEPTKFWGNRDPPELSRLLRGKANRPTKFWGHRDPLELSLVLFGTVLPSVFYIINILANNNIRAYAGAYPNGKNYEKRHFLNFACLRWRATLAQQSAQPQAHTRAYLRATLFENPF